LFGFSGGPWPLGYSGVADEPWPIVTSTTHGIIRL